MNKKITLVVTSDSETLLEDIVELLEEKHGYKIITGFEETIEEED